MAATAVAGLYFGLRPLLDNSFLTHLATGRLIVERGSVPTADPYSFTEPGADWVVQSWLPALVYGWIDRVAGGAGLLALHAVLLTALAVLVCLLTSKMESLLPRMLLTALALVVGATFWSERPLLFGLVCLAITAVIADRGLDPRWHVPLFAVWVGSHGSFPLGFVLLGTLAAGSALDRLETRHLLRCGGWAVLGAVAGSIFPVGPRVLLFPLSLLSGAGVLEGVVEWQAPSFDSLAERAWLLQLLLAVLLLVRRPSYRLAVPTVVFGAASLLALRNIPVASLALLPGMASAADGLGTISSRARGVVPTGAVLAFLGLGAVVVADAMTRPVFESSMYPKELLALAQADLGSDARLVSPDIVGNYLTVVRGAEANVFYDDRFDMYSAALAADHRTLLAGREGWSEILDRHRADAVLWPRSRPLSGLLRLSPTWRIAASDAAWILAIPTT